MSVTPTGAEKMMRRFWKSVSIEKTSEGEFGSQRRRQKLEG